MKTRMERYQALRDKLSSEVEDTISNSDLLPYANRLNKIDHENFEDMKDHSNPQYEPTRIKDVELKKYETFENEYLKDFLDEVKSYNIERGHRHVDDTEQNILEEINAQNKGFLKDELNHDFIQDPTSIISDELVEFNIDNNESSMVEFEQLINEITQEHQVIDDEFVIGTSVGINEDYPMDSSEFTQDSNEFIEKLEAENFLQEEKIETISELKPTLAMRSTEDIVTSNDDIFKTQEHVLKELDKPYTDENFKEDYDPFWDDYLQKMNELEANFENAQNDNRDELNFPTNKIEKPLEKETEPKERDITQEFLALTKEIEKENLESIDLSASIPVMDESTNQTFKLEDTSRDLGLNEPVHLDEIDHKEIRKNRLVNAALSMALAGIGLGVAVALRYFLFR